jgi:hypothetical protein
MRMAHLTANTARPYSSISAIEKKSQNNAKNTRNPTDKNPMNPTDNRGANRSERRQQIAVST